MLPLPKTTSTSNLLSATLGTTNYETVGDFSLSSAGDVILAYQSISGAKPTAANATFLTGILTDDNYAHNTDCDGSQGWYNGTPCASDFTTPGQVSNVSSASGIPPGLTSTVNALHLYPSPILESGSENDNGRYNGTLNGDANTIRALIMDRTNWTLEDDPGYDISATFFNSNTTVNITESSLSVDAFSKGNAFHLYPNPSSDKITIHSFDFNTFDVLNILGKTIKTFSTKPNEKVLLDVTDMNKGVYLLKCNSLITKKLVIN